jgi:hypothetical protein
LRNPDAGFSATPTLLFVRITPYSPDMNAYAERFVRSLRQECLDHFVIFTENQLRRVLKSYIDYYNNYRTRDYVAFPMPRPCNRKPAQLKESRWCLACTATITEKPRRLEFRTCSNSPSFENREGMSTSLKHDCFHVSK